MRKKGKIYEPTTQLRKGSYGARPFNVNKSVAMPSNVKGHKTAHRPGKGGAGR